MDEPDHSRGQDELSRAVASNKRPALLVLVRHGQSVRNAVKRGNTYFPDTETRDGLRGEPDHLTSLTDAGWAQARDAGVRLRATFGGFDYLYRSGYQRTIQTAEGILSAYTVEELLSLQWHQVRWEENVLLLPATKA